MDPTNPHLFSRIVAISFRHPLSGCTIMYVLWKYPEHANDNYQNMSQSSRVPHFPMINLLVPNG